MNSFTVYTAGQGSAIGEYEKLKYALKCKIL